jgi:hypothetical protein
MHKDEENELRKRIEHLLGNGLRTETEPFPETEKEFTQLLAELRALPAEDLQTKLVKSGFTLQPFGPDRMRCQECMYYLVHRKWCDLPELSVPVEADWWCRLWRI